MLPTARLRPLARWTGLCLCVLIVAAWVVCLRWYVWCGDYRWVRLQHGYVSFGWYFCSRAEFDRARTAPAAGYLRDQPAWRFGCSSLTPPAAWSSAGGLGLGLPEIHDTGAIGNPFCREVFIPLWIPFVLIAAPTGLLFLRDRRLAPPGHCPHCGYDLTGNVSGLCPECGTPVPSQRREAVD